jgi:hypothetical protein
MSTNPTDRPSREMRDPSKDQYLELEKRLGAAEYELAEEIAAGSKVLDDAIEARREQARSAIRRSRAKDRG